MSARLVRRIELLIEEDRSGLERPTGIDATNFQRGSIFAYRQVLNVIDEEDRKYRLGDDEDDDEQPPAPAADAA
jgi:hypothetical protein